MNPTINLEVPLDSVHILEPGAKPWVVAYNGPVVAYVVNEHGSVGAFVVRSGYISVQDASSHKGGKDNGKDQD